MRKPEDTPPGDGFADPVRRQAMRKLGARQQAGDSAWFGLGMMGLIGWSVVLPTLAGAALGAWLDRRFAATHSWTLALMAAGLALGCANAWRWVAGQDAAMQARRRSAAEDER